MPGYQIEAYCPVCERVHALSGWGLKFPHGQVELENGDAEKTRRLVPVVVCGGCRDTAPERVAAVVAALHRPSAAPLAREIDWRKLK